jgi:N-acetylglutamate synthase-like GNAT family acetyltransferase
MEQIQLETAEIEDIPAIVELIHNELYVDIANFIWDKPEYIKKFILNGCCLKAVHDEKIVGVLGYAYSKLQKYTILLDYLCIDEHYQKQGIGSKLVAILVNLAESNYGIKNILVASFEDYMCGEFYKKNGFAQVDYVHPYFDREGKANPGSFIFSKDIIV